MNTVSHALAPTEKQIKQSAKAIKSALKELHNFEINYTQALEVSSRSYGFKNWNVASAIAKKTVSTPVATEDEVNTFESKLELPTHSKKQYHFIKPKTRLLERAKKLLTKEETLAEEDLLWEESELHFNPLKPTALFAKSGSKISSNLMLKWANTLEDRKDAQYVYLMSHSNQKLLLSSNIKVIKAEETSDSNWKSGAIMISEEESYVSYRDVILRSMREGFHIFVDESHLLLEILDELENAGYQHYTIAMDTFNIMDEELTKYSFSNVLFSYHLNHPLKDSVVQAENDETSDKKKNLFFWALSK